MRTDTWQADLEAAIEQWRGVPRVVGQTDCAPFTAAIVKAITGTDYLGSFPAYSTDEEAAAIIASYGGVEPMISSALGASKHPSRANVGDVMAFTWFGNPGMGICCGVLTATVGLNGLEFVKTLDCTAAWSI
jgi:hypothetical protein